MEITETKSKLSYEDLEAEIIALKKKIQAIGDYNHLLCVHHSEWCSFEKCNPIGLHARRFFRSR